MYKKVYKMKRINKSAFKNKKKHKLSQIKILDSK